MSEKRFKIAVKTINERIITFTVSEYESKDGRILFVDEFTGTPKDFDGRNCEITEVSK